MKSVYADAVKNEPPRSQYSMLLHTCWIAWRVVDDGWLALELAENGSADMQGTIQLAQMICPMVWRIDTFNSRGPHTVYLQHNGKWLGFDAEQPQLEHLNQQFAMMSKFRPSVY